MIIQIMLATQFCIKYKYDLHLIVWDKDTKLRLSRELADSYWRLKVEKHYSVIKGYFQDTKKTESQQETNSPTIDNYKLKSTWLFIGKNEHI